MGFFTFCVFFNHPWPMKAKKWFLESDKQMRIWRTLIILVILTNIFIKYFCQVLWGQGWKKCFGTLVFWYSFFWKTITSNAGFGGFAFRFLKCVKYWGKELPKNQDKWLWDSWRKGLHACCLWLSSCQD